MNDETRAQRPGSRKRGSPSTADACIVTDATVTGPLTEDWLRRTGYLRAADERARQMRTARIRLDRLLYSEPPADRGCWECPGEFGADGRWRPHCGQGAA